MSHRFPHAVLILGGLVASPAFAQSAANTASSPAAVSDPGFMTGLWTRGNLLGDMFGLRTFLGNYGITFSLNETSEVMGNVSGGLGHGATYDGLTTMTVDLDTQKAFGWAGGTFNASALQIHGRSLSANYLGNIQTASGIEADRATRLWELWYDQALWGGTADVKLGQQSIDQEFIVSQSSALYVNTMMGWPTVPSYDLYAGGPAYPLSSLGIRGQGHEGPFTVLAGAFDDNPPGGPFSDDPQEADADGARFNLNTGTLVIAEIQYALNRPATGDMVANSSPPPGLPGTYKLGFWHDSAPYQDQRYDTSGLPLAVTNGTPRSHSGNFSIYGVADQEVWTDAAAVRSVSAFARLMGAPDGQNLIDFSVNAGLNLKAPLLSRANDTAGLGFGVAKFSGAVAGADQDAGNAVRKRETFIEATYQYQVAPWWQIQPDFQYVFEPNGGQNPSNQTARLNNEAVFGLRTNLTF